MEVVIGEVAFIVAGVIAALQKAWAIAAAAAGLALVYLHEALKAA